jgi:exodeoxyribonuclease VII small subunit
MKSMDKKMTYAEAMKRLQAIVSAVESDELDVDQLTVKLKEAKELITFCKDKLTSTSDEVKKILESL